MLDSFLPLGQSPSLTGFDPAIPCNFSPAPASGGHAGLPLSGEGSFAAYLEQVMGEGSRADADASRERYRTASVDTEVSPYQGAYAPANQSALSQEDEYARKEAVRPPADTRHPDSLNSPRAQDTARRNTRTSAEEVPTADALASGPAPLAPDVPSKTAPLEVPADGVTRGKKDGNALGDSASGAVKGGAESLAAHQGLAATAVPRDGANTRASRRVAGGEGESSPGSVAGKKEVSHDSAALPAGQQALDGKDRAPGNDPAAKAGKDLADSLDAVLSRVGAKAAGDAADAPGESKDPGRKSVSVSKTGSDSTETGRDRRKERLEVRVADLRADRSAAAERSGAAVREGASGNEALAKATAPGNADAQHSDSSGADIVIRLTGGEAGQGTQAGLRGDQAPLSRPGSFANALAQELRAQYNGDIVRHASIVLKNGGDGLIRLALQPGHLGDVKIQLKIADNNIAARIVVKSEEALKAFESELASLRQAFIDGGFDGASLDLSVSADGAGQGQGGQAGAEEGKQPFYTARLGDGESGPRPVSGFADAPAAAQAGYEALSVVEADETGVPAGASRAGGVDYQPGRLRRINMVI